MGLTPFQKRLRGLFKRLLNRTLEPRHGIKATARWKRMPKRLREYYQVAGRLHSINRCFNRLYRPDKLDDEGAYRIFMEENQNVVVWAFRIEDADQENPKIYLAAVLENGELDKWYPEKLPCAEWLVAMVYWQVVNGGFRFGGYMESRKNLRRRLVARWPHILTIPEDRIEFYGRNGQVVCWCGNRRKRGGSLYAAGRTEDDFRKIDKALKVDWSYSDLDDE
jgi:hypothetical protein